MNPAVLQLIDSFHQGGSERQAIQLTRLLCESGRYETRLASLSPEGVLRAQVDHLNLGEIPSFPLTSFYNRNALMQTRRMNSFLVHSNIQILHTHDFYTNIFGMIAGSFSRVPVRIASMRETSGMRSSSQLMAQRIAFRLAHHVVANSGAVRQKLIAQGLDEARITVVHNGLDLQRLATRTTRSESLSLLGLPAENGCRRSYVGIVANMRHDVKDYPMFLRAARRIKNEVQSAAFVMAGEGELMASLRTMARELDLQDSTFFLGRCERIAELISISDVCVLSSKAEGFSNAVLEYMAGARPVVATEVGGASEAIIEGETGYLVKSGDDAGMAERIISLLRDPQRAQSMGELGKQVVEEKFSCEAQLRRTEELYDRLLQERGPLRQNGV